MLSGIMHTGKSKVEGKGEIISDNSALTKTVYFVLAVYEFELLRIVEWRQEEEERINSTLSGAERKAALYMLLEQETQLIASIGRHKIEADSENKSKFISEFLEKVVIRVKKRFQLLIITF